MRPGLAKGGRQLARTIARASHVKEENKIEVIVVVVIASQPWSNS